MTTLEKINNLQYYDGLRAVKDVLKNIFSSITTLETNSVLVGAIPFSVTSQTSGNFIVGQAYRIVTVNAGDNFTNIGRIDTTSFIATATTPTSWSNGTTATVYNISLRIDFNDIDLNLTSKVVLPSGDTPTIQITITNNRFINPFKIFTTNNSITVIDSNNLTLNNNGDFKIEIFN